MSPVRFHMPVQMRAAALFALPVAAGLLSQPEALDHLGAAGARVLPHLNINGIRDRLATALITSVLDCERRRTRARWMVRDALAPLLERRAPAAALLRAGFAEVDDICTPDESRLLVEDAVRRHLRWARR